MHASISQELFPIEVAISKVRRSTDVIDERDIVVRFKTNKKWRKTHARGVEKEGAQVYTMYNRGSLWRVSAMIKIKGGKKETDDWYHPENGKTPSFALTVARNTTLDIKSREAEWDKKILTNRTIDSMLWVIK